MTKAYKKNCEVENFVPGSNLRVAGFTNLVLEAHVVSLQGELE